MITEPIKTYHNNPAVSRSRLMKIAESPEKYRYLMDHEEVPTEALILGSTVHKLVLEPEGFDAEFVIEPDVNKRKNEGKQILEEFRYFNAGKTIVPIKVYELAKKMAASVRANEMAMFLLSGCVEKSFYWTDEITEEAVKCRPDVVKKMNGKGLIVDLKTGTNVSTENFAKEAIKYGYDVQAAMCKEGVERELGYEHDVIYVAVEKEEPYAVNILQADPLIIEYGKRRYRELIGIYHECRTFEKWYGYLGFSGEINRLTLPAYLLKELQ